MMMMMMMLLLMMMMKMKMMMMMMKMMMMRFIMSHPCKSEVICSIGQDVGVQGWRREVLPR